MRRLRGEVTCLKSQLSRFSDSYSTALSLSLIGRTEGPPAKQHIMFKCFPILHGPRREIFLFANPWNVPWFPAFLLFSRVQTRPEMAYMCACTRVHSTSYVFRLFFPGGEIIWTVKRRAGRCCCYHENHGCEFLGGASHTGNQSQRETANAADATWAKPHHARLSVALVVRSHVKVVLTSRKAGLRAHFTVLQNSEQTCYLKKNTHIKN